jgi:hypothetical protein
MPSREIFGQSQRRKKLVLADALPEEALLFWYLLISNQNMEIKI